MEKDFEILREEKQRFEDKREKVNMFYATATSVLMTAFTVVHESSKETKGIYLLGVCGIIICLSWLYIIYSYGNSLTLINKKLRNEKCLEAEIMDNKPRIYSMAFFELFVPLSFLALFTSSLIYIFIT